MTEVIHGRDPGDECADRGSVPPHLIIPYQLLPGGKAPTRGDDPDNEGYDVFTREWVWLYHGRSVRVPLGFRLGTPERYWLKMFERSGLSEWKQQKGLLHSEQCSVEIDIKGGVLDMPYRGEVCAVCRAWLWLHKTGDAHAPGVYLPPGFKIAQMVIFERTLAVLRPGPVDMATSRGEKAFGSSGN